MSEPREDVPNILGRRGEYLYELGKLDKDDQREELLQLLIDLADCFEQSGIDGKLLRAREDIEELIHHEEMYEVAVARSTNQRAERDYEIAMWLRSLDGPNGGPYATAAVIVARAKGEALVPSRLATARDRPAPADEEHF